MMKPYQKKEKINKLIRKLFIKNKNILILMEYVFLKIF